MHRPAKYDITLQFYTKLFTWILVHNYNNHISLSLAQNFKLQVYSINRITSKLNAFRPQTNETATRIMPISYSYLKDRVCSIFSNAGKFCFAHGLRQLIQDSICDVSCLQTSLTCRSKQLRVTHVVGHHTTSIVNILFKTLIFPIIGKKNNQSSVSGADWEIPTLGSTNTVFIRL